MMRRKQIINVLFFPTIVACFVLILLINNRSKLPGELVLEQEMIDFKEAPEWEGLVTRSLAAQNRGKSKLVIERIETGCSYVKIEGPKEFQPGEKAAFQVVFNPEVVSSEAPPATAIIFTDSSRTPQVYLTISSTVKRFAELSAQVCDFGEIAPNTINEKKILLRVNAPIKMDGLQLMPPSSSTLKWEMSITSSSERLLSVKLGPVKARGMFSSVLTIVFPKDRTMTLPVVAQVVGPLKVLPQSIFYGTITQGDKPSAEIVLKSPTPFKVLQIHAPKALVIDNPPGKEPQTSFTMKVRWHSTHTPQVLREEVRVMTNVDSELIRIPVYGIIREKR